MRWTEFNLAIVLDRLGEHEAARRLWESVLASSDHDEGIDSELSRQTATNLAITLRKLRRYGDEFPLRVRVLETTTRSLGPDAAATFRAEIDLAQTHRHLGNHELALGLFTEALAGLERTEETRGRSCTRSGPSPPSWWRSSDRRKRPGCSTRSWPARSSTLNLMTPSGGVRCGSGGAIGFSASSPVSAARAGPATHPAADAGDGDRPDLARPGRRRRPHRPRARWAWTLAGRLRRTLRCRCRSPRRDALRHGLVRGDRGAAPGRVGAGRSACTS